MSRTDTDEVTHLRALLTEQTARAEKAHQNYAQALLDVAECRASLAIESEVADVCMSVVEQCRALVEGHACSCWRAE